MERPGQEAPAFCVTLRRVNVKILLALRGVLAWPKIFQSQDDDENDNLGTP